MQHENRYQEMIVNTICWHFQKPLQGNSQNRHKMARESKHARLSIKHRCLRYMNTVNFTLFWIPECSSYIYVLRQRTSWLKPVLLFYSLIYIWPHVMNSIGILLYPTRILVTTRWVLYMLFVFQDLCLRRW